VNRELLPDLPLDLRDPRPRPLGRPRRFPLIVVLRGASPSLLSLGDTRRVDPLAVIACPGRRACRGFARRGCARRARREFSLRGCARVARSRWAQEERFNVIIAGVSLWIVVPSDELSTVGVRSQSLNSSANTVVSSPLARQPARCYLRLRLKFAGSF